MNVTVVRIIAYWLPSAYGIQPERWFECWSVDRNRVRKPSLARGFCSGRLSPLVFRSSARYASGTLAARFAPSGRYSACFVGSRDRSAPSEVTEERSSFEPRESRPKDRRSFVITRELRSLGRLLSRSVPPGDISYRSRYLGGPRRRALGRSRAPKRVSGRRQPACEGRALLDQRSSKSEASPQAAERGSASDRVSDGERSSPSAAGNLRPAQKAGEE